MQKYISSNKNLLWKWTSSTFLEFHQQLPQQLRLLEFIVRAICILWYFLTTHFFLQQIEKKRIKMKYSQRKFTTRTTKEKKGKNSDFSNVHILNFFCHIRIILNKYLHYIQCARRNIAPTNKSNSPTHTSLRILTHTPLHRTIHLQSAHSLTHSHK